MMGARCRVGRSGLSGWLAAILVTVVLMACGGSGSGDMAGVGTGGTGTVSSVVSMGPISGFGSVIVAGVRYEDSHAVVTDEEGNVRGRDALKLGMVTTIRGSADFVAGSGVAESIRYGSELVGPVESVDLAGGRFTVLGASVSVKASTVFDERLAGLAALRPGDVVEVYGGYNAAAGAYTATRIEPRSQPGAFKLRGSVSGLDGVQRRFTLAGVLINYAAVPASELSALAEGALVQVSGSRLPSGGVWRVEGVLPAQRAMLTSGESKLEGSISSLSTQTAFVVDGVHVDASAARIDGPLAVGLRVEVEGFVRNGVLVAREVESSDEDASDDEAFDLSGVMQDFDPLTQRFRLRGQWIDAGGAVIFEGGTRAELANGRHVEVKGRFDSGSGAIVAARIEFEH
ncbi:DUF5666 domain-containing protein [Zoogloea sp.]|uniref:DUF5666 domain-containing protein n=1 Tax=Zoogloea sp. TaxID=49181 RepID=UPI001D342F0C|nr:DUF5666 domain-containing protein [Zoogloea sp.]MBK6654904.1 hypothetical protein [Zoogloea sp.]